MDYYSLKYPQLCQDPFNQYDIKYKKWIVALINPTLYGGYTFGMPVKKR